VNSFFLKTGENALIHGQTCNKGKSMPRSEVTVVEGLLEPCIEVRRVMCQGLSKSMVMRVHNFSRKDMKVKKGD